MTEDDKNSKEEIDADPERATGEEGLTICGYATSFETGDQVECCTADEDAEIEESLRRLSPRWDRL